MLAVTRVPCKSELRIVTTLSPFSPLQQDYHKITHCYWLVTAGCGLTLPTNIQCPLLAAFITTLMNVISS